MLKKTDNPRAVLFVVLCLSVMCMAFGGAARGSDLLESIRDGREPAREEQFGGTVGATVDSFGDDADYFGDDADYFGDDTDYFGDDTDYFGDYTDYFGDYTDYFGDYTDYSTEYDFLFDGKPTFWNRIKGRFTDTRLVFGDFCNLFFLTSPTVEFSVRNLLSLPNTIYQHYKMAREGAGIRQQMRREVQQACRDSYNRAMQDLEKIMAMQTGHSATAEKKKGQVLDNLLKSGVPPGVVDKHMDHLDDKIAALKKAETDARQTAEEDRLRRRSAVLKTPRISQLEPENGRLGYSWCGPTSLRMIYTYYGRNESTRDIANRIYDWKGHTGTYSTSIVSDANKHGFPGTYIKTSCDFEFLEARLNEGKPVIVNVDVSYKYGHYMVLVGLEGDRVILNDPYYKGVRREMSRSAFLADWDGRSRRCIVVQK